MGRGLGRGAACWGGWVCWFQKVALIWGGNAARPPDGFLVRGPRPWELVAGWEGSILTALWGRWAVRGGADGTGCRKDCGLTECACRAALRGVGGPVCVHTRVCGWCAGTVGSPQARGLTGRIQPQLDWEGHPRELWAALASPPLVGRVGRGRSRPLTLPR